MSPFLAHLLRALPPEWHSTVDQWAFDHAGELLAEMAERDEREKGRPAKELQRVTLSDLGVSKSESARFQQAAAAPEEAVQEAFDEARKNQVPQAECAA